MPTFPVGVRPELSMIADWVELAALADTTFLRGDLKSAIHREDIDGPELVEQQVWHMLESRQALFGPRWPLRLSGARLTARSRSPISTAVYRHMCLLGMGAAEREDRRLFEEVVAALVTPLSGGVTMRIGHPASGDMPGSFKERLKMYASRTHMSPHEVKSPPFRDDKDLGLDVASALPFGDRRGGDLHFLVQCSTGRDWKRKLSDLSLDEWRDHMSWAVHPVRVFAAPQVIPDADAAWIRASRRGGLLLDRPRLVELGQRCSLSPGLIRIIASRVRYLSEA